MAGDHRVGAVLMALLLVTSMVAVSLPGVDTAAAAPATARTIEETIAVLLDLTGPETTPLPTPPPRVSPHAGG